MDYSKQVEELILWFKLVDLWDKQGRTDKDRNLGDGGRDRSDAEGEDGESNR